ncbi:MAG: hypothetical protein J7647_21005 [Cyanobacteria bacterium SBLK]|nr:hypothetical protein [Cyanobacteria bacterium SBLK]
MQRFIITIGLLNFFLFLGCASDPEAIDTSAEKSDNPAVEESAPPHTASRQQIIDRDTALISPDGMGKVKFGMTLREVKEVLGDEVEYVIESPYIVDADAIAVRQDGEVLFYLVHPAEQPLQDRDLVTMLQTNNPNFKTREGVYAGMLIEDAEKIYGEASFFTSELESRESVSFQNQPDKRIHFGTLGGGAPADATKSEYAGIYRDLNALPRETQEYRDDAIVQHISVICNLDVCWRNY